MKKFECKPLNVLPPKKCTYVRPVIQSIKLIADGKGGFDLEIDGKTYHQDQFEIVRDDQGNITAVRWYQ